MKLRSPVIKNCDFIYTIAQYYILAWEAENLKIVRNEKNGTQKNF